MIFTFSYIEKTIIRRLAIPGILLLVRAGLTAQPSLVVNGSFDDSLSAIPSRGCNTKMQQGYVLTKGWYQVGGSADFYNADLSRSLRKTRVRKARSGQGRMALVLGEDPAHSRRSNGYREFVQTKLTAPLKAGALYSVNFYVARDNRSVFHAPEIGAYFSTRAVVANEAYAMQHISAHVKTTDYNTLASATGWHLVHGYYRAQGGEQFLTLGNFGDPVPVPLQNASVPGKLFRNDFGWYAYYYIDDVVVYETPDTSKDDPLELMPPALTDQPYNNLVFVLDVSGSMQKDRKLGRLKEAVGPFLRSLNANERISVLTFEASPTVLARNVPAAQSEKILRSIDSLRTGGGTNVNAAIWRAYDILDSTYIPGGNNRVILVTDAGYQVSPHAKELIAQHASEKQVGFSTLIFDEKHYPAVKHLNKKNKGSYYNVNETNAQEAFSSQARERKIKWYGPGRRKTYTYFTVRLVLFTLVAGLVAWKVLR